MDWLPLLAEGDQGGAPAIMQFVPILIFFVVMMIFMGRSSARQRREQEARLAALKKNDKVITSAGLLGTVVAIIDNEVTLKVDETSNTRIRVLKSSVIHINPDDQQAQQTQPQTPTT